MIGPSQSGKTSLLRCINRTIDFSPEARVSGTIKVEGEDVRQEASIYGLCRKVGMVAPLPVGRVFQRPNPLPISVYENLVFGPRIHGELKDLKKSRLEEAVETSLSEVGLWNDPKDRLDTKATGLQLEQQQKPCIARLLPLKPRVILSVSEGMPLFRFIGVLVHGALNEQQHCVQGPRRQLSCFSLAPILT